MPRPPRNLPPSLVAPPMSLLPNPPAFVPPNKPPAAFPTMPAPGILDATLPRKPPAALPPTDAALPPPFRPIKPNIPAPTVLAPSQSVLRKPPLSSSSSPSLSFFFLPFPKPNGKRLAIIEANRKSRLACFSSSACSFFSSARFLRLSAMPFSRKPSPSTSPKVPAGSGIRLSKRL